MIEKFKTVGPLNGANIITISHDSNIMAVCQANDAIFYNLKNNTNAAVNIQSSASAALTLTLQSDAQVKIYYVLLATADGHLHVFLPESGGLVSKLFVHQHISHLKVNYSQDLIYALAENTLITIKISYNGFLAVSEKCHLLAQTKDIIMLGSTHGAFLSQINITQNGEIVHSKYDTIIVGVGHKISFYGKIDKREGSWTMGQLEDSLG